MNHCIFKSEIPVLLRYSHLLNLLLYLLINIKLLYNYNIFLIVNKSLVHFYINVFLNMYNIKISVLFNIQIFKLQKNVIFIIIYLYFFKKINIDIMQKLHIFIILHFFKKLILIIKLIFFISVFKSNIFHHTKKD